MKYFPKIGSGGGGSGSSETTFSAENKSGGTINKGVLVTTHTSGVGVIKAIATSLGTIAIGLCITDTANAASCDIRTDGVVTLVDWTNAVGSSNLSANSVYFLDPVNSGMMTTVAPTTLGQIVQRVGHAVSPTSLFLEIEQPILL